MVFQCIGDVELGYLDWASLAFPDVCLFTQQLGSLMWVFLFYFILSSGSFSPQPLQGLDYGSDKLLTCKSRAFIRKKYAILLTLGNAHGFTSLSNAHHFLILAFYTNTNL